MKRVALTPNSAVMPCGGGHPVRRSFWIDKGCLWNTGFPAIAGNDGVRLGWIEEIKRSARLLHRPKPAVERVRLHHRRGAHDLGRFTRAI